VTPEELYFFYSDAGSQMAKVAVLVSDPNKKGAPKIRRFMTAKLFGKNRAKKMQMGKLKK